MEHILGNNTCLGARLMLLLLPITALLLLWRPHSKLHFKTRAVHELTIDKEDRLEL